MAFSAIVHYRWVVQNPFPGISQIMGEPLLAAIVGEVGALNKRARLLIPAAVRKATPWLSGREPIELIAELVPDRQLRLYSASRLVPALEKLRARVIENYPGSLDHLAAFKDRYRAVTFYPSDTQVHLGETIAVHLRLPSTPNEQVYIETFGHYISVMSLEHRRDRLDRLQDDLILNIPANE